MKKTFEKEMQGREKESFLRAGLNEEHEHEHHECQINKHRELKGVMGFLSGVIQVIVLFLMLCVLPLLWLLEYSYNKWGQKNEV